MNFSSLLGLADFIEETAERMILLTPQAAKLGALILFEHIEQVYGDNFKLAELSPYTQEEREKLGFTPDDPLFRDGGLLRDNETIETIGDVAAVGNDQIIAFYQELGYHNVRTNTEVPARPVHLIGLQESREDIELMEIASIRVALGESLSVLPTTRQVI